MTEFSYIIIGVLLLTTGRRLFWLFVGCLGFVAGMQMAQLYFGLEPVWMRWGAAILLGLVGALLAMFFQTLAIGMGGFVAGSTITAYASEMAGFAPAPIVFLIGGIIGMILLYIAFDWALIGLSAVVGSTLIVQSVHVDQQLAMILYAVLIASGIGIQATLLYSHPPAAR